MSAITPPEPSPTQERPSVRPLLIIMISLCSLFIISYALRLDERDRIELQIIDQRDENMEAAARTALLAKELADAAQTAHVDEIARTVLDMAKPDDVKIVPVNLVDEAGSMAEAPFGSLPASDDPVWRQWLELFVPLE